MTAITKIDAEFIETPHGRLFTCYSHPTGELVRSSAVLLLYPGDHEYKMVHWAYRSLAGALSKEGWPVLRFDYTGTGDSSGETGTGDLEMWTEDAMAVGRHLLQKSRCQHLQIIGVRMGAFIAARLTRCMNVLNTIFWDAPLSGQDYLRQLAALETQQRNRDHADKVPAPARKRDLMANYAGFPLSRQAMHLITTFHWVNEPVQSGFSHSVVSGHDSREAGCHVPGSTKTRVDEFITWADQVKTNEALLAPQILKAITNLVRHPNHE